MGVVRVDLGPDPYRSPLCLSLRAAAVQLEMNFKYLLSSFSNFVLKSSEFSTEL